jgi:flagellar assembly protein FliH
MKPLRPYRFPSLTRLNMGKSAGAEHAQADWDNGFAAGESRGYDEGYAQGLQQGRLDGAKEGHREGLALGRDDGRRQVKEEFAGLARPLDEALARVNQLRDDYQAALRRELVDLVAKVARQVIRCELALQPRQLLTLVEETLAAMPASNDAVEVAFNPLDMERVIDLDPQRAQQWNLVADPRLEAGECRVKRGGQEADAGCRQRLQACIDQIEAQVLDDERPGVTTDLETSLEALAP